MPGTTIDLTFLNEHAPSFSEVVSDNIETEFEPGTSVRFIWLANPA